MRLSKSEVSQIKEITEKFFEDFKLYLHGSRLDDLAKGGDIDLFIVLSPDDYEIGKTKKFKLQAALSKSLREQKVDLTLENEADKSDFFNDSEKMQIN